MFKFTPLALIVRQLVFWSLFGLIIGAWTFLAVGLAVVVGLVVLAVGILHLIFWLADMGGGKYPDYQQTDEDNGDDRARNARCR